MANWAWPHTPASHCARLVLIGGPFDGEEAAFLPPDHTPPVQIVWSGWFPWGFRAYLYEWRGETRTDRGRTDALVYRPPVRQASDFGVSWGQSVPPEAVPPVMAEAAELWADGSDLIRTAFDVPAEMMWPGL